MNVLNPQLLHGSSHNSFGLNHQQCRRSEGSLQHCITGLAGYRVICSQEGFGHCLVLNIHSLFLQGLQKMVTPHQEYQLEALMVLSHCGRKRGKKQWKCCLGHTGKLQLRKILYLGSHWLSKNHLLPLFFNHFSGNKLREAGRHGCSCYKFWF